MLCSEEQYPVWHCWPKKWGTVRGKGRHWKSRQSWLREALGHANKLDFLFWANREPSECLSRGVPRSELHFRQISLQRTSLNRGEERWASASTQAEVYEAVLGMERRDSLKNYKHVMSKTWWLVGSEGWRSEGDEGDSQEGLELRRVDRRQDRE